MPLWRVASTTAVIAAIGACTATVVGFAAARPHDRAGTLPALPSASPSVPAVASAVKASPSGKATVPARSAPASGSSHPSTARHASARPRPHQPSPATHTTPAPHTSTPAAHRGRALPLPYGTGAATQVVTVVASSASATTATVQAWTRAAGGGWRRFGPAIGAHVGSQGLTAHPSESKSATPIGSFTLTQAFGSAGDPGTRLPYFRTDAADWWVSDVGSRYYNTHYRCTDSCPFDTGAGENLLAAGRVYTYAVVIDYNRFPVRAGAGSAFFLHVTDGGATAGCVSIPKDDLVSIMRWLRPAAHPRIVIGVR